MNIALIDEHYILIDALKRLLVQLPDVTKVTTYTQSEAFLSENSINPPDILVLDLGLKGWKGMELLSYCRTNLGKDMKVIVISTATDTQTIRQSIRRGANSFLSKTTTFAEFKESIYQVRCGNQYIEKALRDDLINGIFVDDIVVLHLSPREKQVLQKICDGQTIKEIAFELRLSIHTIQYYHRNVMDKLQVRRTTDLIVYAMQHGLYLPKENCLPV
ncbi:response regulator transcription factor [Dyadobacter sp. CY107]|uniref:LuxR C-terminal-related transcriptional regulator n=1 Tax=Dyadobacter fanqingshengii TaxID=2906443 RepID=UPI001F37BA3A|nr:response regulator transcription factor [Dyadobacter fanqingshengii]MCF2502017.1 response regulator transcription factor [Dyadobacter fanqingshengii]